jgi:hypothetical protein
MGFLTAIVNFGATVVSIATTNPYVSASIACAQALY